MDISQRYLEKITFLILSIILLALGNVFAQEADYSAIVLDIVGKASVQQNGKGKEFSIESGDLLYPGDVIKTEDNSTLTIEYIESNRLEKWPQGKNFTVGKTKTDNVPADVKITERSIPLPKKEPFHMGGDVMRARF